MHRLAFLEPGHFHAALTLRERHPGAADEVLVYAAPGSGAAGGGPEIDEFLALLDAFNRRAQHPTAWKPVVRVDAAPVARLVADRRCDVVILAGRNDRKMALARRLHDAGLHVLADKPWITQAAALADVRHVLSGGARTMEMMTSRHAGTAVVAERLVRDPEIFGGFDPAAPWPIDLVSVHHLEKSVNGAPLRRPPWYFDVRAQGDGLADIPTHLIDQAQRLVAASPAPVELLSARRWSTAVPRALFARVTGTATFPPEIEHLVERDVLAYACNAEIAFRLGGVGVHLTTRWDLTEPPNGGDAHRATVTGTHARIRIEQGPSTKFRRTLTVEPRDDRTGVNEALGRALRSWQNDLPGIAATPEGDGFVVEIPVRPGTAHEAQFPLVLDEFLRSTESGPWPDTRAADTLVKYELIARALTAIAGA